MIATLGLITLESKIQEGKRVRGKLERLNVDLNTKLRIYNEALRGPVGKRCRYKCRNIAIRSRSFLLLRVILTNDDFNCYL